MKHADGNPVRSMGEYAVVYQKQPERNWEIIADCLTFHDNLESSYQLRIARQAQANNGILRSI